MTLVFNPDGEGLRKVLKDYEAEALRFIWERGGAGAKSVDVWRHANDALRGVKTISRASVIYFLNDMCGEGVLRYVEQPGKGGYHRVYIPMLDERAFKGHVAGVVIRSLMRDFPEETREAIEMINLS